MTDVRKIAEQAGFNIYENEIFFNHEYVMTENIFKVAMLVEQEVLNRMPNPAQVLREQQKMLDGVADKLLAPQENPEREKKWLRDQFAMAALQGIIASNNVVNRCEVTRVSYDYADLMLTERDKEN
jgi:hypothetical protein